MEIGGRVRTVPGWGGGQPWEFRGSLIGVREVGAFPLHPERTHVVRLDHPFLGHHVLAFDPADLEPDTERTTR